MFDFDGDVEITNDVISMVVPFDMELKEAKSKAISYELEIDYEDIVISECAKGTMIKVTSTSEVCESIRNNGDFFEAVADAINVSRDDIIEID